MSKSIQFIALVGFVASVAACNKAPEEDYVLAQPAPVTVEPTFNSKY
ncbi:hypothetical protein [Pseudodonghicola xiamenensis]|uniref:Lipoprotein n=1 Tax=Pseudodonghicola xiamenensis TaxID=337702 RepID=A0A8J3HBF8_9RHOB|nr:hypothetical protein [Pseudodonghicola xiamenensis]GHG99870.1 hypothetical protein GCM10010961_36030 [Pseudodonghicola xiamenensis]